MNNISIPAHFDGERILLDEPFELKTNAKLIVTVLPNTDTEHESWSHLSGKHLEDAYAANEPDYPLDLIKEAFENLS